jgi:hypothetical protein
VVQEVSDGHGGRLGDYLETAEVLVGRGVEVKLGALGQAHHGRGGDDLRHREPQVARRWCGQGRRREIGESEPPSPDDAVSLDHRDRKPGYAVRLDFSSDVPFERFGTRRVACLCHLNLFSRRANPPLLAPLSARILSLAYSCAAGSGPSREGSSP